MNIVQHQINGVEIGIQSKDGYLNATKLSEAYKAKTGKTRSITHWLRTKDAKEYREYVSSVIDLPITELVIVRQGGKPSEQGTWIHPDLSDAFALWLSVEYKFQVAKILQAWREEKANGKFPQNITGPIERSEERATLELIRDTVEIMFTYVPQESRTGMALEGAFKIYPDLRPALEQFKPKLLIEKPLVTPTRLGELLEERTGIKHSPRKVNQMLADRNLQKKTGLTNPAWEPMGQGLEYGQVIADTARGHGKTVQSCRWYESVIELLLD